MGVYIPNWEKPKSCDECWAEYAYEICNSHSDTCPLVPVPPHGDLFDISKVKITPSDDEDIAYEIDFGKTVIPAEPFNNLSKPFKDDEDIPICTKASPASLGICKKAEESE